MNDFDITSFLDDNTSSIVNLFDRVADTSKEKILEILEVVSTDSWYDTSRLKIDTDVSEETASIILMSPQVRKLHSNTTFELAKRIESAGWALEVSEWVDFLHIWKWAREYLQWLKDDELRSSLLLSSQVWNFAHILSQTNNTDS